MNILDIILLICFIPTVISGLHKGMVSQLIGLLTIFLGCRLAVLLEEPVSAWLAELTAANPGVIHVFSFILIFIVVAVTLFLAGKIIERLIKIILLGWLNRLLGVIISLMIFAIVSGILGIMMTSLNNELKLFNPAILNGSIILDAFKKITVAVMPYLKSLIF